MKNLKTPIQRFTQLQSIQRTNSLNKSYDMLPQQTINRYFSLVDHNEIYENILPRSFQQSSYHFQALEQTDFYTQRSNHFIDQNILDPIWQQLDRKYSPWRPFLSIMIAECFGRQFDPQNTQAIYRGQQNDNRDIFWLIGAVELLRNGTLIVDDIEDGSNTRSGKPTLHNEYGIDIALNTGNWLYFQPWLVLDQYRKEGIIEEDKVFKLQRAYFEEVSLGHLGQNWDHSYSKNKDYIPTVEEFMQMTIHKCFVRKLQSRSLAILLDLNEEESKILYKFGMNVGLLSQLHNDMINLLSEDYGKKVKGMVGEDILSGRKSLMVIYAYHNTSEQNQERLLEILNKEDNSQEEINEAISIIRESGAFEFTQDVINEKLEEMFSELRGVAKNQSALSNIQTLITQTFLNY